MKATFVGSLICLGLGYVLPTTIAYALAAFLLGVWVGMVWEVMGFGK